MILLADSSVHNSSEMRWIIALPLNVSEGPVIAFKSYDTLINLKTQKISRNNLQLQQKHACKITPDATSCNIDYLIL